MTGINSTIELQGGRRDNGERHDHPPKPHRRKVLDLGRIADDPGAGGGDAVHIGRTKVYELMATGRLRSVRIGRSRRVTAAALADFVARLDGEEG